MYQISTVTVIGNLYVDAEEYCFHTKDFVYENSWDLIVHFCFECAWLRNKIWSELTYHVDGLNQ